MTVADTPRTPSTAKLPLKAILLADFQSQALTITASEFHYLKNGQAKLQVTKVNNNINNKKTRNPG